MQKYKSSKDVSDAKGWERGRDESVDAVDFQGSKPTRHHTFIKPYGVTTRRMNQSMNSTAQLTVKHQHPILVLVGVALLYQLTQERACWELMVLEVLGHI